MDLLPAYRGCLCELSEGRLTKNAWNHSVLTRLFFLEIFELLLIQILFHLGHVTLLHEQLLVLDLLVQGLPIVLLLVLLEHFKVFLDFFPPLIDLHFLECVSL